MVIRHATLMTALLLTLSAPCVAQDSPRRLWQETDLTNRMAYMVGVHQAVDAILAVALQSASDSARAAVQEWRPGSNGRAAIEIMDEFYSDPANDAIPWIWAYRHSMRKLHGATAEELQILVESWRKVFARTR